MAVKPKLALIPSGVGTDKLYSVLPADGTGDFTFDRNLNTATRINKDGLIEMVDADVPRLNYPLIDGVVSGCPSLLLEPESTNLIQYSEDFSQSVWSTWQSTKILSNNINPKGTNGYYEILHNGNSSDNPNTRLLNVSLNGSYTLSFFVKINQSRYISLSIEDYDGDRARVYFDTINKTFTTIINVGSPIINTSYSEFSNGWIRISLSVNLLNAVYNEVGIGIYNPSGSLPSASGEVISVFGAQLEQGSYPTSYIPTSGAIATRSAETCNNAGDVNTFNDSQGVLMVEGRINNDDGTSNNITLGDGTFSTNRLMFLFSNGVANRVTARFDSSGSDVTLNADGYDLTINHKIVLKYKENDIAIWVDGFEINSGNSFSVPTTLNRIDFYNPFNSGQDNFYGNTKQIQYFDTALTDTDLEELTSWTSFNEMANAQQYTIL